MTTPRVANSSVPSMPLKIFISSAATTTSQNTRTTHLVLRPHGTAEIRPRCVVLSPYTAIPPGSVTLPACPDIRCIAFPGSVKLYLDLPGEQMVQDGRMAEPLTN